MTSLHEYELRAKEQMQRADYGGAIRSLTEAIALASDNLTFYLSRGLAYYMRRDYDLAVEDLTTALFLDPQNLDALLTRGNAHLQNGNVDDALADYNEYINIAPDTPDTPYARRAAAYASKGEMETAIENSDSPTAASFTMAT